ncbi:MAG TPA: aldehyde dehydrogenase family protein [Pyrinomonadaceae bacterium]|jgi:succinate-semialdehyde dehydrogenase/glutarate-semialdehyde dehydrogenase
MSAVLSFPSKPAEIISYNPATGEELGRVPETSAEDVKAAVEKSRAAFRNWRETSFATRRKYVMKAREVILSEMDEIARLISDESGKPVAEAFAMEIAPVLDLMQYFARRTERLLKPRKIDIGLYGALGRSSKIVYQPLGVVGIIPAWNYPFSIPLGEAAMALMAGNTVVIKPSELTPLVGLKIGEIFRKAGLPEAVVQIVTGAGNAGAALVEAAPDKIMFTGSVATGKRIAEAAARNLTSVVLELGGKDAMIVFADANFEIAADAAVWGAFCNAGQSCSSVERLYVEESAAEKLTNLIVEKTKKLKLGAGHETTTDLGAMSSERQLKIVEDHVASFEAEGARVLTGGKSKDLFFEPTVIAGATNAMRAMREETFGPTLPIATFRTEEEAIRLANDSEFGLTASVWTRDLSKGKRVAERIEAGTVCVNEVLYTHGIGQTPWGGFKNSGRGRTHGVEGLMELVQPQHIHVNRVAVLPNAWWLPYGATAIETFKGFAKYFASGSMLQTSKLTPQLLKRIKELRRK